MAQALVRTNKKLARIVLYSLPVLLLLGGSWVVRNLGSLDIVNAWLDESWEDYESVRLFQEYLRFDTSYPDGNEIPAAEFLAGVLGDAGFDVHLERVGHRNANLWARLEGDNPKALVLHNHIDVEPVLFRDKWREDPFGGAIDPPFIYGRGAFDMKSIAIAQLMAVLDLQRGDRPRRSVVFLATADEERDSYLGTQRLLPEHPEWREEFWAVLTEGGAVEAINVDEVKYWGTEFQQKRFVDVWVCDGDERRLKDLRKLIKRRQGERRMIPAMEAFFAEYAPSRDRPETRKLLQRPDTLLERLRTWPGEVGPTVIPPYVDAMLREEVVAFPVEESDGGGFEMRLILHLMPDAPLEVAWERLVGDDLEGFTYTVIETHPPVEASPLDHEVFRGIDAVMARRYPEFDHGPLYLPWTATDARFFRQYGIPAYGFGPFRMLSSDAMSMKGVNERVPLPAFVEGVDLYVELVRHLAGPADN